LQSHQLLRHRRQIDRLLFFKGIDVAWDVEVVIVFLDLAQLGNVAEFLDALPLSARTRTVALVWLTRGGEMG
jgi:hypothetical protein